ncbi:MAG TPA: tRNA (adenosine(37)-N6)-dimethylallyltransferase MiaA [Actinomycetota bacterium]|nr:tRNA (adenosine(37)-N6)-dimethylallyltransferase MiaA [Actinomycetota bacterium]
MTRDGDATDPSLLALVGPTATGKTDAAIAVAERLGAEIVSVDSMLVYRGMDVGTAKPTAEQRSRVPHHLIDVAEPSEPFSVARYQALAREAIAGVRGRGRRPLLVGGTALYLRAIADDLELPPTDPGVRSALEAEAGRVGAAELYERLARSDPVAAAKIEPANVRRTVRALEVAQLTGRPFSSFAPAWERFDPSRLRAAGIRLPRVRLAERIRDRVAHMLELGLLDEVAGLVERGFGDWLTASQAIGYAEFARHLAGELTLEEAVAGTVRRTTALARRQVAFLRRDPRIRWFEPDAGGAERIVDEIAEHLDG